MSDEKDLVREFKSYVKRFDEEIGVKGFGEFGTWNGKLIKKLKFDEFSKKWKEYKQLDVLYTGILERGDTVNDIILKSLRDCAAELLIDIE